MKRCPECRRDYSDDTLLYCLEDGAALVQGSVPSPDEPATAIFHDTDAPGESETRAQIHTTEQTAVLPSGITPFQKTSVFDKRLLFAPIALAVIVLGGFFGYRYFMAAEHIRSIAVMPFVNESGDPDVEYLCDGMTEDLISSLTEIRDLSVKARSTVFYYKGKNLSPKQIGDELNVDAVLLGRVVQRGDGLKLNLELVDVNTLDAIWSKSYDRTMKELVDVQSEIARNVSLRLRSKLTGEEQREVASTRTANSDAQQLYLKGRFHWNKRNIADFERAEDYFLQAIEKDPGYALAYTGLADTYSLKPYFGSFRPKEYFPKARQAIQKAIELDPELAEAYASLGQLSIFEYDFTAADRAYKKAIELDPKNASAHQWYAESLSYMGKSEEAVKEIDIALELEPLSLIINHSKGFILEGADRTDEAIAQGEKTVELFPAFAMTHANLSREYAAKGNYEKAAEHNFRELELAGVDPEQIRKIKAAYEKDGWKGLWTARLEMELAARKSILDKDPSAFAWCNYIAWAYAALEDKEKTLEYLNLSYEQREPAMVDLTTDYSFDFLKGDPRFEELIKKVGFPARK